MGTKDAPREYGSEKFDPALSGEHFGLPKIEVLWSQTPGTQASLKEVRVGRLTIAEIRADVPLLAMLSFPKDRLFVSFPAGVSGLQQWDGVPMESGALLLHTSESRMRWRSLGWNRVGFVSFSPADCDEWGQILFHCSIARARTRFVLHPQLDSITRLLQLHSDTISLAERDEGLLCNIEIIRSLEDELIVALMTCLSGTDEDNNDNLEREICARTLRKVEDAILCNPEHEWSHAELCTAAAISTRRLGVCCNRLVRMPTRRYIQLLKQFGTAAVIDGSPKCNVSPLSRRPQ